MTRVEREREKQCMGCRWFNTCLVKWGKACKYQQGKKIPRLWTGLWVYYSKSDGSVSKRPRGNDVIFG